MKTHHILIVDDQRDICRMLSTGLKSLGKNIQVLDVPSGEEAMLILSRQPVDLLVTDIRLPGITGLELKERACLRNPDLKLIVITGVTDPQTIREVQNAGVDGFFIKPIEMSDFLQTARMCLGQLDPDTSRSPVALPGEDRPETKAGSPAELSAGLEVETALPEPEPASALTPEDGLHPLSRLRDELPAVAVLLADERGQVLERLGSFQDPDQERELLFAFRAAFAAGARLSGVDGDPDSEALLYFSGRKGDYLITQVGRFTVLAGVNHTNETLKLDRIRAALRQASEELLRLPLPDALPEPDPELAAPSEPIGKVDEGELAEVAPVLDEIFGKGPSSLDDRDVDAFWEALVENGTDDPLDGGSLSFEQAQQLGLKFDEGKV